MPGAVEPTGEVFIVGGAVGNGEGGRAVGKGDGFVILVTAVICGASVILASRSLGRNVTMLISGGVILSLFGRLVTMVKDGRSEVELEGGCVGIV